jgi:hypothetical protein
MVETLKIFWTRLSCSAAAAVADMEGGRRMRPRTAYCVVDEEVVVAKVRYVLE